MNLESLRALPAPGLPRRLVAMLYDTFLVLPLVMAVVAAATLLQVALFGSGDEMVEGARLNAKLVQVLTLVTVWCFFAVFWRKSGQTLGMQAWRIQLISADGSNPSSGQLLRRGAGALLSAACLGLGYFWCLFDSKGRYWHDQLSGTELKLLPPRPKKKRGEAR